MSNIELKRQGRIHPLLRQRIWFERLSSMNAIMKKKIGTIVEEKLLASAKQRAAAEDRALDKFASHGGLLQREEIEEILNEDILAP